MLAAGQSVCEALRGVVLGELHECAWRTERGRQMLLADGARRSMDARGQTAGFVSAHKCCPHGQLSVLLKRRQSSVTAGQARDLNFTPEEASSVNLMALHEAIAHQVLLVVSPPGPSSSESSWPRARAQCPHGPTVVGTDTATVTRTTSGNSFPSLARPARQNSFFWFSKTSTMVHHRSCMNQTTDSCTSFAMKRKTTSISTLDELVEFFKIPTKQNGSKSYEEMQRIVLAVVRQELNDKSNHVSHRQLERITEGAVKHSSINRWKKEIEKEVSRLPTTSFAAIVAETPDGWFVSAHKCPSPQLRTPLAPSWPGAEPGR